MIGIAEIHVEGLEESRHEVLLQWPFHLPLLKAGVGRSIDEYHEACVRPVHGQVCFMAENSFGQGGHQVLRLRIQLRLRLAGSLAQLQAPPLTLVGPPPPILRGSLAALGPLPLGLAVFRFLRLRRILRLVLSEHQVQLRLCAGGPHHLVGFGHFDPRIHWSEA